MKLSHKIVKNCERPHISDCAADWCRSMTIFWSVYTYPIKSYLPWRYRKRSFGQNHTGWIIGYDWWKKTTTKYDWCVVCWMNNCACVLLLAVYIWEYLSWIETQSVRGTILLCIVCWESIDSNTISHRSRTITNRQLLSGLSSGILYKDCTHLHSRSLSYFKRNISSAVYESEYDCAFVLFRWKLYIIVCHCIVL